MDNFGSDATFRQMKAAFDQGDRELLGELLMKQVEAVVNSLCANDPSFSYVQACYKKDFCGEAFLKAWRALPKYLQNPLNDPDQPDLPGHNGPGQRQEWFNKLVHNKSINVLKMQVIGNNGTTIEGNYVYVDSVDRVVGKDGEENTSLGSLIPDKAPTPDQAVQARQTLSETFNAMFSLDNSPEILTVVAYVIISNQYGEGLTMNELADLLNGQELGSVARRIHQFIRAMDISEDVLSGMDKAIAKVGPERVISGLTGSRITNRKNAVLTLLRSSLSDRSEK